MTLILAVLLVSLGAPPAAAADCASCHKAVVARKALHGPVAAGACEACHVGEKPGAGKRHTFSLAKEQPELCLSCHEDMRARVDGASVPHPAIAAGGCTACHDPHGAAEKPFMKGKTMAETCAACHDPVTSGAVVHPPAQASCALCHDVHGGTRAKLLKAEVPALCFGCHAQAAAQFQGKHVHGPVQAGCPTCHSPHSGAQKFMLKLNGRKELCLDCHTQIAKVLAEAKRPHPAVEKGGCVACHTPHTTDEPMMLKKPLREVCLGCHTDKRAEMESQFLHGPVALNQCQGCHAPHGSDNPKILNTYFPPEFYNQYKDGLYALCFNCHEKDIASEPKTTKLTGFRNGDKNLHFVHVNGKKGRSCKACHQVHGSGQEKHIRESVPFGSWLLPITFKKTATGGGCNVGCHAPRSYDREKPVVNP